MSYYEWLIKNYAEKDTAIGDLARDILSDEIFPENEGFKGMFDYLIWEGGACDRCIEVFKESWRRYVRETGRTEIGCRCKV